MQHLDIRVLVEDVGLGVMLEVAMVPPVGRGTLRVSGEKGEVSNAVHWAPEHACVSTVLKTHSQLLAPPTLRADSMTLGTALQNLKTGR